MSANAHEELNSGIVAGDASASVFDAGVVTPLPTEIVVPLKEDELAEVAKEAGASLAKAAEKALTDEERAAIMASLSDMPRLTESGIAPEVLAKLLPDDEVVVLPRVSHIAGGLGYRFIKRVFDVVACGAALIILAIPMAVIAVKIKSESAGPVIYAQRRVGLNGKVVEVYKFRSMYMDAEARGAQWATEGDPRVTPFGRVMRKTRLDEIPQFWNVVKGNMSLIGPRPERPAFHDEFCKRINGWEQRLLVKPGITGLAQVMGGYELLPKEKALYDIEYIENRSIGMDWRIILKTIQTVFSGEGSR